MNHPKRFSPRHWLFLGVFLVACVGLIYFGASSWNKGGNQDGNEPGAGKKEQRQSGPPASGTSHGGASKQERPLITGESGGPPISRLVGDFDEVFNDTSIDSPTRLALLNQLVMKMAAKGESATALASIQSHFGPGENRNRLIQTCFRNTSFEQFAGLYGGLEYEDEKVFARNGVASSLARLLESKGHTFTVDRKQVDFLGAHAEGVIATSAVAFLDIIHRTSPENSESATKSVLGSISSPESLESVAAGAAQISPFDAWAIVDSISKDGPARSGSLVIEQMLKENPQRSIELITASPNAAHYLSGATFKWLQSDANAPIKYLADHGSTLSQDQADRIRRGIVDYTLSVGEVATAKDWANQISDEKLRPKIP